MSFHYKGKFVREKSPCVNVRIIKTTFEKNDYYLPFLDDKL